MRSIKYKILFSIYRLLLVFILILPKAWVPRLGIGFGLFMYYLGVRKSVVMKNLEIAFGEELSLAERKTLRKKTCKNIGCTFFELLLMNFITPESLGNYIEIEGLDILKEAVGEGKGVILAGNHFDHWELMSAGICTLGLPSYIYTGQQSDSMFDEAINRIRRRFGATTISKSKAATIEMMRILKKNNILGLAGDLNVPSDRMFVDFFGVKASIGQGLSSLALARKAPLLFVWCTRKGPLKHQGHIVRLKYTISGNRDEDANNLAQLVSAELEKVIRRHPEQYWWFNRRWKTRPPGENRERIY
ncbi:MAG: hypothetical protein GY866_11700 [Proteobacteria bacterium]|nr:hypothetical protein [Pseudomonadota bacterium]